MDILTKILIEHPIPLILGAFILFILPRLLTGQTIGERQTIVTSTGMFFTFGGIVYGLILFDSNNVSASIPTLLEGLTTAFFTSIGGIGASIALQTNPGIYGLKKDLIETEKTEKDVLSDVVTELKSLNKNIAGEGDTSLTTQIVKMRSEAKDNHEKFLETFDNFAEKMAKSNTEELIKSIRKVMDDFRTTINDQLGEDFTKLSSAVTALVEWQNDYQETIKLSTERLKEVQESLRTSSESLENTSDKVDQIAENNKKIEELNTQFTSVVEKLNQMLGSTVEFSQGMESLSKELSGSGENIRKEVKGIVDSSIDTMKYHAEESSRNINSMIESSIKNMQNKNNDVVKSFEEINRKTLVEFGENIAAISTKLATDFRKVQDALSIK